MKPRKKRIYCLSLYVTSVVGRMNYRLSDYIYGQLWLDDNKNPIRFVNVGENTLIKEDYLFLFDHFNTKLVYKTIRIEWNKVNKLTNSGNFSKNDDLVKFAKLFKKQIDKLK